MTLEYEKRGCWSFAPAGPSVASWSSITVHSAWMNPTSSPSRISSWHKMYLWRRQILRRWLLFLTEAQLPYRGGRETIARDRSWARWLLRRCCVPSLAPFVLDQGRRSESLLSWPLLPVCLWQRQWWTEDSSQGNHARTVDFKRHQEMSTSRSHYSHDRQWRETSCKISFQFSNDSLAIQ